MIFYVVYCNVYVSLAHLFYINFFFFNEPAPTEIYTNLHPLSLHDALPIWPSIAAWLDDPAVIEVMLNPDGRLWLDRLGEGISDTGELLSAADGERIEIGRAHV